MTRLTEKNEMASPCDGAPDSHGKIHLPVKTGHAQERMIELELGRSVIEILEIVAPEFGCPVEELFLFREGENEPLAAVIIVEEGYPHRRRHHVHRAGQLSVTVHYNGLSHTHSFNRSATVDEVRKWAIEAFGIDQVMGKEFELSRQGQAEELPRSEHIGHLAGKHHELVLDLVRGVIPNGGWF